MAKSAINLMAQFIVHDATIEVRGQAQPVHYRNFTEYVTRESAKAVGCIDDVGLQKKEIEVKEVDQTDSSRAQAFQKRQGESKQKEQTLGELTLKYIGNEVKTDNVFNDQSLALSHEELTTIHQQFDLAQANQTPLWQFVFSFDNDYLKDCGLMSQDGKLYDKVLKQATRQSIMLMKKELGLNDTMTWIGGIHYNTDNIHIHVAVVETESSRDVIQKGKYRGQYKASLPKGLIWKMRGQFASGLNRESPHLIRITELMRENLNESLKRVNLKQERHLRRRLKQLVDTLPEDRRLWRYNMNAMEPYREEINALTRILVKERYSDLYEELDRRLMAQEAIYTRMFSNSQNNFRENRLALLDAMLGNTLLKQLKKAYPKQYTPYTSKQRIPRAVYRKARQLLLDDKQKFLNQLEHERLEQEQLSERSREINY